MQVTTETRIMNFTCVVIMLVGTCLLTIKSKVTLQPIQNFLEYLNGLILDDHRVITLATCFINKRLSSQFYLSIYNLINSHFHQLDAHFRTAELLK